MNANENHSEKNDDLPSRPPAPPVIICAPSDEYAEFRAAVLKGAGITLGVLGAGGLAILVLSPVLREILLAKVE